MKKVRIFIFGILALLIILFIFSNSAQSRSASIETSSTVMDFIKPLLDPHNRISDSIFHHYLRKAAHFTEFSALGFSLMGVADCFSWKSRNKQRLMPLLVSLIIAVSDETLQFFSPARGPGILDVLIDFCGAAFGVVCMAGISLLIHKIRQPRCK